MGLDISAVQAAPAWAVLALDSSFGLSAGRARGQLHTEQRFLIVLSVLGSSQPLEHVSMPSFRQRIRTEWGKSVSLCGRPI